MRDVSRHWLASAVLFAAFGVLALAVRGAPGWVVGPDARVGALLGGRGLTVAESLSWLASWPVWTSLVLVGGAMLWRRGARRVALLLVLADVSADLLALVSKLLVDRTPPGSTAWDLDVLLNGSFFPSGHAVRATVVLGLGLMRVVPRGSAWASAAVPAALALLLALGASRVAVHAHLPSDILGGYLLGAAWVELTLGLAPGLSLAGRADERRLATPAGDQPAPG